MFGDIIYVERRPIVFGSTKPRENPESRLIDRLIYRFVPYRHYGIEVENEQVIHFYGSSFRNRTSSKIIKSPMEDFRAGGKIEVLQVKRRIRLSREDTVRRAHSALGEAKIKYSVNKNNCEHFAYWCATGNYYSTQSDFLGKGKNILELRKKVVPITTRTKKKTIELSMYVYKKILRRA